LIRVTTRRGRINFVGHFSQIDHPKPGPQISLPVVRLRGKDHIYLPSHGRPLLRLAKPNGLEDPPFLLDRQLEMTFCNDLGPHHFQVSCDKNGLGVALPKWGQGFDLRDGLRTYLPQPKFSIHLQERSHVVICQALSGHLLKPISQTIKMLGL